MNLETIEDCTLPFLRLPAGPSPKDPAAASDSPRESTSLSTHFMGQNCSS